MTDVTLPHTLALVSATLRTNTELDRVATPPTALLVTEGRITLVGTDDDVRAAAEAIGAPVHDLRGATVTPGLYDSHTHPHWAVELTRGIYLGDCETIDELRQRIAEYASTLDAEAWVTGWGLGFDPFEHTPPRGALFDDATDGRPMIFMFHDLHSALANDAALAATGVTEARAFDDASEIVVDDDGVLTGELREPSAYRLVFDNMPQPSHEDERDALRDMFRTLASVGLTGGAIMDGKPRTVELIDELEQRGELDHRVTVHHWHAVGDDNAAIERVIAEHQRSGQLWQTGAVKLFSDGVIDTGTAWLHQRDACGDGGQSFWPDWDRYREVVRRYHDAGMLIATHAVGDRAVKRVLEVYAELPERPGRPFHTIEHLEVLSDEDIDALRDSGVTASMQPLHMQWREADESDNWAQRLGSRADTGYRVRDVLDAGVRMVLGSDWPVAQYDPRVGMAWARGRHLPGQADAHVYEPDQRLSGEETLLAYTLWPAQARGHHDAGFIGEGAVADLTVWQRDPVAASADALIDIPILMTVVDGRVVFDADGAAADPEDL